MNDELHDRVAGPTEIHEEPEFVEAPVLQLSSTAIGNVNAGELEANLSAFVSTKTGMLSADMCALAFTKVEGDAHITGAAVPIVTAGNGAALDWCYTSAVLAAPEISVTRSGAAMIAGNEVSLRKSGALVAVGSSVKVKRGFVGMVFSGKTEISEDSRVLIGSRGAWVIAAAILGGLLAVAWRRD